MSSERVCRIWLTRGFYATVSAVDYARLNKHKWYYDDAGRGDGRGYAVRKAPDPQGPKGKRIKVYMHRDITNCPEGLIADHANNKRLDNRRKNLRITTHKHNANNCEPHGEVGLRGVDKRGPKSFRSRHNGVLLGTYPTAEAAAEAYDMAALAAYGEFAYTNYDRALYALEGQTDDDGSETVRPYEDVPF